MSRGLIMALWLVMVLAVVLGVHYYLWARLVRDPLWPAPWRQIGTGVIIFLGVLLPLSMVLGRLFKVEIVTPLVWMGYIWMGFMFLFVTGVLTGDIMRLLGAGYLKLTEAEPDPERRVFFARLIGGSAATSAVLFGGLGLHQALTKPRLKHVKVALRRLPPQMDGTVIVQITDLHVGPTIGRAEVVDLVRRTNELNPDVVAITGDLVDGSVSELRSAIEPLADLRSRYGTFFVTGNHEYYSGADSWIAELERLGIKSLRNERVTIGDGEASFDLAGVDDQQGHRFGNGHGTDVERACADCDPGRELILLAHQPKAIGEAAKNGVGLQLSGHTHGGQIWPFGYLVSLTQPYMSGLHQHTETTQIYVSCGTGYWGPPMRVGIPSELTRIELASAAVA